MDEELKGRLVKYLDALERGATKVGEFAETEVPQTIKEWLIWHACQSILYALIFLLFAVVLYVGGRALRMFIRTQEDRWTDDDYKLAMVGAWVVPVLGTCALFCGTLTWAAEAVKCAVAPRVVIVEKFVDLVKPAGVKK